MPFKSKAQRRWMYSNDPEMAHEWEAHTPKDKELPEKVAYRKHLRRVGNIILDVNDEILQDDPGYKKLKHKVRHKFMKKTFWDGFEKQAGIAGKAIEYLGHHPDAAHAMEIGGLGVLAVPDALALMKHPMKEKNIHRTEVAGLGALAVPSVAHFARKIMTKGKA